MLQTIEQLVAWADRWGQALSPRQFVISAEIEVVIFGVLFTAFCIATLKFALPRRLFRHAVDKCSAASCAMLLFRKQPVRVFCGAIGVLVGSGLLLVSLMPAILISGGVLGLAWNTLANRYSHRPLKVGQPVVMCIVTPQGQPSEGAAIEPYVGVGIGQITAVVMAHAVNSAWLRLVPAVGGLHELRIGTVDDVVLNVNEWRAPALAIQQTGPAAVSIAIAYPPAEWSGIGRYGWAVWFIVVCAVASLPLAWAMRVRL